MRSSITNAFRINANAQQNPDGIYLLVTLTHSELDETYHLTNAPINITSNGNLFLRMPMEITLSDDTPDRPPQAKVVVANVDRRLVVLLRSTNSPASVKLQVVQISDPDTIEAELDNFTMRDVSYDALAIQGTLSLEALFDEPCVDFCFTPTISPGLFS